MSEGRIRWEDNERRWDDGGCALGYAGTRKDWLFQITEADDGPDGETLALIFSLSGVSTIEIAQDDSPEVLKAKAERWLAEFAPSFGASPEQMLREFHASKAIHGGLMPAVPTADIPEWVQKLRLALLDEEVQELHDAVEAGDIVQIADALGDIEYVTRGTAVAYGIPSDAVFAEIHRSNMTKVNTPDEAKLVKGRGYRPPRIAAVLADAAAFLKARGRVAEHARTDG